MPNKEAIVTPTVIKATGEEKQPVQGVMPDSINEWYVALALDRMKLEYSFQYALGDPSLRGGQTIDFVVWKATGALPVFVQGAHWHNIRTDTEDRLKQAAAERYFKTSVILLMENETNSREAAMAACIAKIGF